MLTIPAIYTKQYDWYLVDTDNVRYLPSINISKLILKLEVPIRKFSLDVFFIKDIMENIRIFYFHVNCNWDLNCWFDVHIHY